MGDEAEKIPDATGHPETPGSFLTGLGKTLHDKESLDADLAHILATHLLTATPAKNAVAQAQEAIVILASERATLISALAGKMRR
jgi:hypothetical protein